MLCTHPPRASLINSLLDSMMHVQNIDLYSSCSYYYCRRVANWATVQWPVSPWWLHHPWGTICPPPLSHPMVSPASIRPIYIPTSLHGRPFAISHSIVILIVPDIIISSMRWVVTTTIPNYLRTYLHIHSAIMGLTKITLWPFFALPDPCGVCLSQPRGVSRVDSS